MFIERLERRHDSELIEFLDSLAEGPCGPAVLGYHYPENREMLCAVLGPQSTACWLALRATGTGPIKAILPGMIHRSANGACYNSLPFFGPNAGVIAIVEDPAEYGALAEELTATAIDLAREAGALTAVFYSPFNPNNVLLRNPYLDSRLDVIRVPRKTMFLRLSECRWVAGIRRDLRAAITAGVEISADCSADDLDQMYAIYEQNCIDYAIPRKPRRCIEVLHKQARSGRRIHLYIARLKQQIIGGLIVLWGPQTASYYLPCCTRAHRSLQHGSLAIDRARRDAIAGGLLYWNWESSPENAPGVAHFKKKWGSHISNYEVCVVPLQEVSELERATPESLAEKFPFYFVYPYNLLKGPVERLVESGCVDEPLRTRISNLPSDTSDEMPLRRNSGG